MSKFHHLNDHYKITHILDIMFSAAAFTAGEHDRVGVDIILICMTIITTGIAKAYFDNSDKYCRKRK